MIATQKAYVDSLPKSTSAKDQLAAHSEKYHAEQKKYRICNATSKK